MNTININEITTDGYFVKYPHPGHLGKRHLRLAALIGVQPDEWYEVGGVYTARYENSTRPEVIKVVTVSSNEKWYATAVHREGEPVLLWEEDEDILRTARWWLGIEGDPNFNLVVDHEYVKELDEQAKERASEPIDV